MLMSQDILTNQNTTETNLNFKNKINFIYNLPEFMNDKWKQRKNPFFHPIYELNTIGRIILYSRNSLNYNLKYNEECKLYDDYIVGMKALKLAYEEKCNVFRTNDQNIYLYNMLSNNSATKKFNEKHYQKEIIFRESINKI